MIVSSFSLANRMAVYLVVCCFALWSVALACVNKAMAKCDPYSEFKLELVGVQTIDGVSSFKEETDWQHRGSIYIEPGWGYIEAHASGRITLHHRSDQ